MPSAAGKVRVAPAVLSFAFTTAWSKLAAIIIGQIARFSALYWECGLSCVAT